MFVTKNELIVCRVRVDRFCTPQEALAKTDRVVFCHDRVTAEMPRGSGEEVEVVLFKVGGLVMMEQLEKEYQRRHLIFADPFSLLAINADNPNFANDHPNKTYWQDVRGNWCVIEFGYCRGEHYEPTIPAVFVGYCGLDGRHGDWFAGLCEQ